MSDQWATTIPGRPASAHRDVPADASASGHAYTPPETREYQSTVADTVRLVLPDGWALDALYRVEIVVYYPDRRNADVDNVAKVILDALTGLVWEDDRQIAHLVATRRYDPDGQARVRIGCRTLSEAAITVERDPDHTDQSVDVLTCPECGHSEAEDGWIRYEDGRDTIIECPSCGHRADLGEVAG